MSDQYTTQEPILDRLDDAFRHAYASGTAPASYGIFAVWLEARHDDLRMVRARLSRDRAALEKVRKEMRRFVGPDGGANPYAKNRATNWIAELDAILDAGAEAGEKGERG